ncbi:hypothetical protein J6590_040704 [Homalodisca vitripennis]|nr:hypothetical protein J6590_040704 [Homalodisca vitripennis]
MRKHLSYNDWTLLSFDQPNASDFHIQEELLTFIFPPRNGKPINAYGHNIIYKLRYIPLEIESESMSCYQTVWVMGNKQHTSKYHLYYTQDDQAIMPTNLELKEQENSAERA